MLDELSQLMASVPSELRGVGRFRTAVEVENRLNKRSAKTRALTLRHLVDLYGLDPEQLVFRGLSDFWGRDEPARPLLALTAGVARDALLAQTAPEILKFGLGTTVTREAVESIIEAHNPGRFSAATRKSVAQNINSTLTQSGHLEGRANKRRRQAEPSAGSVAYALLLGFASGVRGNELFRTQFMQLQDVAPERAMELAEDAARKGWITFKRIGDVMEAAFPRLITGEELRLIHEQG